MKTICLTPVKNEEWILEKFLECAEIWADIIIIADQSSTDCSIEIAMGFSKVTLVDNTLEDFSEQGMRTILISAAREIEGPRLLLSLDADEFFTPNFGSPEWELIRNAPSGTVIQFDWINLRPDMESYWEIENRAFGFVDDGSNYSGKPIHGPKMPAPQDAPIVSCKEVKVIHYQYVDWKRMESKHRWYQCWEQVNQTESSAVNIYRKYHHMYGIKEFKRAPESWFEGYLARGIDIRDIPRSDYYWWDHRILDYIEEYGAHRFKKLDIWNFDYAKLGNDSENGKHKAITDPRSIIDKLVHKWMKCTQENRNVFVKAVDKLLKLMGW